MTVVYNEFDPAAAAWLRELIHEGLIASGDVDERSIKDVRATDYRGYAQVHCFAGIGVWSHALRRAGWPDDRPVGTGSCPCQPFSAAGAQRGFDDPRHLWPEWRRLVVEAREQGQRWADTLFGEQVATAGHWLDLVRSDLEALGYAFGAPDLPAAGFGGAHIRQRLYWVADAHDAERWSDLAIGHLGDWPQTGRVESHGELGAGGAAGGVGDTERLGIRGSGPRTDVGTPSGVQNANRERQWIRDGTRTASAVSGLGDASGERHDGREEPRNGRRDAREGATSYRRGSAGLLEFERAGATCDWIWCRDELWRPVEAGTFPLAASTPGRLGLLRGYGNALDAEVATQFVSAFMEAAEIKDVMAEMT